MKHILAKFMSYVLSAALLCAVPLVSGCQSTERKPVVRPAASSATGSGASSPQNTSSAPASTNSAISSSSASVSSSEQSTATSLGGPHFSFPDDPDLRQPTGVGIEIRSLSDALGSYSAIASKTPEGSPEQIVKTLLEKNILCFAAVQGKNWSTDAYDGIAPIQSGYIQSVEQMESLFAATYTENQAWRLMHPQEAGGYGDLFQYNEAGALCFDLSHLRKKNGESFSVPTYAGIIEANDSEITFGRYYNVTPSPEEPNNMHFKAVKEYGEWRLDTYITDAPGFKPLYTELIPTGRVGAPELMELAKRQVGNIGGRKYWEWYGFDQHIEWCAAFVSWMYYMGGKDGPYFTGCYTGAEWYKEHDMWGDRYYADIAPGDAVFFDWNLDGDADHVGLVLGTDGDYVYTIEGNRDDICVARAYSRYGYEWICGYGLMNWGI